MKNNPRIMIAAPKSGSGKTLITCALLGAIKNMNLDVCSYKCGPDYIDPMFHRTVLDIPSENLDTFFLDKIGVREILADNSNKYDISVIEGVMGLFDGLGGTRLEGSAYHLAMVTETPIILVVDVHGMGRSMIPLIQGFINYDSHNLIKGVILNRISQGFYNTVKPMLDKEISVPVLGYFPINRELTLDSRHLGLKLPGEIKDIKNKLNMSSSQLEKTVFLDKIIDIANTAKKISDKSVKKIYNEVGDDLVLGVARDEAFCFYYEANLNEFIKRGIKIKYFSPLRDKKIPNDVSGILLGGGYPELYARELSLNEDMKRDIKTLIENGLPSLAECGGFMYLHRELEDDKKQLWPMVGVVDSKVFYTPKLTRFGYVEVEEKKQEFLNEKIKGHEFHYYDSEDNGDDCIAIKPVGGRKWDCIHKTEKSFWGFPHLYYPSSPDFVEHFIEQMKNYKEK